MEQKRFLSALGGLAKLVGFTLTPELVELYDRGMRRFGYDRALKAVEEHIITRRGQDRFPSIGDLVRLIQPEENDDDAAVEVAGRIFDAIARFGYWNPKEAQDYVGEVGWLVVARNGGWAALCEGTLSRNVPALKAQFREMALSILRRARAGTLGQAPRLPSSRLPAEPVPVKSLLGG